MKRVLSSLVVLGILLCMFMSLGISADAAEGPKDLAVVALAFDELSADQISNIKQSQANSDVVIVDINGLDFEQSGEGYNYAYVEMDQGPAPGGYSYIWGGMASVPTFTVSDGAGSQCTVVLLPVGGEDTVESINAAVDSYKAAGTAVVIAVAPDNSFNVQAAVDSNADKVLTCGEPGVSDDKLIKVGGDSANPVSLVRVAASGSVTAENMPLPAAADPGLSPVEPEVSDPGVDPAEPDTAAETTTYTITFQPGEGATGEMASATAEAGTAYGLPGYCDFTCPGYDFIGWQIGEDVYYAAYDQENQTSSAGTVTVNSDITATALWKKQVEQYTVSFYPNLEGVAVQNDMNNATQDEGTEYTLPACAYTAEGYEFVNWQIDGVDHNVGDVITVDGDKLVYAVWKTTAGETADPALYTITFANGDEAAAGEMAAVTDAQQGVYTLPECKYTLDGYTFAGWSISGLTGVENGTVKMNGDTIQLTGEGYSITLTATWKANETEAQKVTVTYKANNGKSENDYTAEVILTDGTASHNLVTAEVAGFTAPEGKEFDAWNVPDVGVKAAGEGIQVTKDIEITAQWKDKTAEPQQNVSPFVDGTTPAGDLTYTQGGTDTLNITYKAVIDKVTVNNSALVATQDYTLSADGKTLTFMGGYLNKVLTGTYPMQVTFKADADGTTYANDTRNLVIKASPTVETDPPANTTPTTNEKVLTWDRAHDLTIDLSEFNMGSPTKLEIKYSDTDWREVKAENYVVNGTTITLKTSMLPANWPNQGYTYRVTFGNAPMTVAANGTASNTALLKLQVTGIANGGTTIANVSPSPSANNNGGGTSPVTGDTNNVTLYIVLLVVLIAALAAVLIIVMKRRRR